MLTKDLKEKTYYRVIGDTAFFYIVSNSNLKLQYESCYPNDSIWRNFNVKYIPASNCGELGEVSETSIKELIAKYGRAPSDTGDSIPKVQKNKIVIPENKNSPTCVNCYRANKEVVLFRFSTYYCPECEP